jgi:hypothetical protein
VSIAIDLRAVVSEPMAKYLSSCDVAGHTIRPFSSIYEDHTGRVPLVHLTEGWEISAPLLDIARWLPGKRVFDIVFSVITAPLWIPFGLIVAAGVLPEWLVPLAITVALSFLIAAPLNRMAHPLFERLENRLVRYESAGFHPDEEPADLGDAEVLIMGMGRTGTAAYDFLGKRLDRVIGLDADPYKVSDHVSAGRNVVYSDAEDSCFWHGVDLSRIRAVVLAMDSIEAKRIAARQLRTCGFSGRVIAHALYDDEVEQLQSHGVDETYLTMAEAGIGLAEHVWEALGGTPGSLPEPA